MNPQNNPAALAALLPAALFALAMATAPYALAVDGNALAPRVHNGDLIAVTPAVDASPCDIASDSLVLAVTASDPQQPCFYDRPAVFILTDSLSLASGTSDTSSTSGGTATVPYGSYIVLGIVQEGVAINVTN